MRQVVAALVCCAATACAGSSVVGPNASPDSTTPSSQPLPIGKADLTLSPGDYRSPDGFEPALHLSLDERWHSVHRGSDAFDIGRPAPHSDSPDVAVIFLTPRSDDTARLVGGIARRYDVTTGHRELLGRPATTAVLIGGRGEILRSSGETIGLYADKQQMVRMFGLDVDGSPLVVVVLVPEQRRWPAVRADVQQLLAGVEVG